MVVMDRTRLTRLQAVMRENNVDLLVCRLPENVVYLTDYWPHHGVSVAVLAVDGDPEVFVPEIEAEWAEHGWARVHPFGWSLVGDEDEAESHRGFLAEVARRTGGAKTVAVELDADVVGPSYRSAEPIIPTARWSDLIHDVFADSVLADSTPMLTRAREVKSPYEIQKLRVAAEVAEAAIRHAQSQIRPGMSEAEIGAIVEGHARAHGPGYKSAELVRCSAEVTAGPNSTKAVLLVPSTASVVNNGDLVMIEVGTVVDGYWSDLTYMSVVGEPTARQREVHNIVLDAQSAAISALTPGIGFAVPDERARAVLSSAGLATYYPHITGHGIGLRYHEGSPMLMPGATGTLKAGMYTSVEPGVYIPGFGGIRIEDDVLVGEDGPLPLSTIREPW